MRKNNKYSENAENKLNVERQPRGRSTNALSTGDSIRLLLLNYMVFYLHTFTETNKNKKTYSIKAYELRVTQTKTKKNKAK